MKELGMVDKARKLLEKGWCCAAYARDILGHPVPVHSERASSFCLVGAILHVTGVYPVPPIIKDALMYCLNDGVLYTALLKSASAYNDSHSKEQVLGLVGNVRDRLALIKDRRRVLRRFKAT